MEIIGHRVPLNPVHTLPDGGRHSAENFCSAIAARARWSRLGFGRIRQRGCKRHSFPFECEHRRFPLLRRLKWSSALSQRRFESWQLGSCFKSRRRRQRVAQGVQMTCNFKRICEPQPGESQRIFSFYHHFGYYFFTSSLYFFKSSSVSLSIFHFNFASAGGCWKAFERETF